MATRVTKAKAKKSSKVPKTKKSSKTNATKSKTSAMTPSPPPDPVDPADAWVNKDADANQRVEFRRIIDDLQRLRERKDTDQFTLWEAAFSAERHPSVQFCLMGQNFDKFLRNLIGIPPMPYRCFVAALQHIAIAQLKFVGPTGAVAIGAVLRGLADDAARTNMASHVFPLIFDRFSKHVEGYGAPPTNGSAVVYDIARQHGLWTKKGTSFKTQSAQAITTIRNMVLKNREGLTQIQSGSQCSTEIRRVLEATDRIGARFLMCLDEAVIHDSAADAAPPTAVAAAG